MSLSDFEFPLPEELIASRPADKRDAARLMVLRRDGRAEHRRFSDIIEYLSPGDMLLLNNTRVTPCRLRGARSDGRAMDVLLVRRIAGRRWQVLSKGGYTGEVRVPDGLVLDMERGHEAELHYDGELSDVLMRVGMMPLPPYIKRDPCAEDMDWYQTVYAEREGSIAAPTAGLHFTPELLGRIRERGVLVRFLTLHVGVGTFTPIRADNIEEHRMEPEEFEIDRGLLSEISALRGRLFTVGTTTTRAIEGYMSGAYEPIGAASNGGVRGRTDVFIRPGHGFRAARGLLTNFHLPRSTPLMLAAAFAGRENLLRAYREAVAMEYGFFSYGDAMLII